MRPGPVVMFLGSALTAACSSNGRLTCRQMFPKGQGEKKKRACPAGKPKAAAKGKAKSKAKRMCAAKTKAEKPDSPQQSKKRGRE